MGLPGSAAEIPLAEGTRTPAHLLAGRWWRALLVTGYLTGWRVGQLLALRRADVDLDAGLAVLRVVEGNKGKREVAVRLHPAVIDHLRRVPGFTAEVFAWPYDRRTLWDEWTRLLAAAGLAEKHYRFHDLRRAFGTLNAAKMAPAVLQHLMQHRTLTTTMRYYVNPLHEMDAAVGALEVPAVLRDGTAGNAS